MDKVVSINNTKELEKASAENVIIELTEDLLTDVRDSINSNKAVIVPMAELSTLGAGVSSLIPAFNTVTQTTSISTEGIFKVANATAGDTLKMAKNGNAWGAMRTATGGSKMVQLAEVDSLSSTTKTVAAFNPATILMAAALYSIEKDLAKVVETQKEIKIFLEIENESQIEADVETLMGIVINYKYNWDNEISVASSHKLAIDIQNRARKNMIAYQKNIENIVSSKQRIAVQSKVNSTLSDLEKKFKYYRLSLYNFSLASLMEIMLSGNYTEDYIDNVKGEIESLSYTYREHFEKGSIFLEKLGNSGVEANIVKGIGTAEKAVGKLIGSIPLVKEGATDEFLQDKGTILQSNAIGMEMKAVRSFAAVGNPGTKVFVEKMEEMIQIYNHTSQIYFDGEKIYLLA